MIGKIIIFGVIIPTLLGLSFSHSLLHKNRESSVILYDGVCALCNNCVKFVLNFDSRDTFKFASLQSDAARKLLKEFDAESFSDDLSTIVLIENYKDGKSYMYTESTAALRILLQLDLPWPIFYSFVIVPGIIRDSVYHLIGDNRYEMFGKEENCVAPPPEHAHKFIS